jgi:hypothetical protein
MGLSLAILQSWQFSDALKILAMNYKQHDFPINSFLIKYEVCTMVYELLIILEG